jgi:hypothetical protein
MSKSHWRSMSLRKFRTRCWSYNKVRNFKRDYKEEKVEQEEKNDSKKEFKKLTQEDGKDDFIGFFATQACQYVWLIESRASFYMNFHCEWFSLYEECGGGKVYLSDNSRLNIFFHGRVLIRFPNGRVIGEIVFFTF